MTNRTLITLIIATALTLSAVNAWGKTTLKFATLAPENSAWDKVFKRFKKEVEEKSGGELELKIYNGGVQGDEEVVVRKMKSGQLDGSALTAVGLSKIVPNALVLQLPGLFNNYKELDYVRGKMNHELAAQFEEKGYVFLGWGDVGFAYIFSNTPIETPEDMKKVKMWAWSADPIASVIISEAGGNPIPLSVPDVLPSLQTGAVDAFTTSPLAGIALRWFTKAKYMGAKKVAVGIGASVVSKKVWDKLSPEHQDILRAASLKWHKKLIKKVRKDNKKSLSVLKKHGISLVKVNAAQSSAWDALALKVQNRLAGKVYSKAILETVRKHLRDIRK
jgi:TRAP-type C4-dicarboxylate transport system substrate-binding protein